MRKIVQANVGNPPSEKDLSAVVRAIIQNHLEND
jgi:hypothetical protein